VPGKTNILELGAGCGIVGIALASSFPNCWVHLTDLVDAQDILSKNVGQATPARGSSLSHWTLDWSESLDVSFPRDLDLIVVSDCTYNPDSSPDLVRTLTGLCSISPESTILIAMKRRHESEGVFFNLMEAASMQSLAQTVIELPHEVSNDDSDQPKIELYLFRLLKGVTKRPLSVRQ
jgi:predicted nicotinamide N-methyase